MTKVASKSAQIITKFFNFTSKATTSKATAAISALLYNEDPKLFTLGQYTNRTIKKHSYEQNTRRLLDNNIIEFNHYATAILTMFALNDDIELVIDRTNYKYGAVSINFFVLAVIFRNTAIPLYWLMLDNKGGNSTSDNRIDLIKWFITNFPDIITHLYADREFPSNSFLQWLKDNNIPFVFRTKSSVNTSNGAKKISLAKLYHNLHNMPNQTKVEHKIRRIYDCRVFLHARLNNKNEQVFLISSSHDIDAFELYQHRWTIENMFGKFKTKGFNLESSKLTNTKRLSSLFLLMAIAYSIALKIGTIANNINPIPIKCIKENKNIRTTFLFSLFNFGSKLLEIFFDNYLSSKVAIKQLQKILNYPPNHLVNKRLAIYTYLTTF